MHTAACPLCYRSRDVGVFRPLYGAPVCSRCRSAFVGLRLLACLLDWLLWSVILIAAFVILALVAITWTPPRVVMEGLLLGGTYVVAPLTLLAKDGFSGHSPGKLLCGLRVVDEVTGRPAGFPHSIRRNLVLCVPLMPLVLAFLLAEGHRIGDGWARTRVIRRKHAGHPVFTGRPADCCTRCRYDLTGNTTGICSECGTPVVRPVAPVGPAIAA